MTDLCTALADALRKCAEKWPDRFRLGNSALIVPPKSLLWIGSGENLWCVDLTQLHIPKWFMLDDMDAVAAALGMEFDVFRVNRANWGFRIFDVDDIYPENNEDDCYRPSKREASLAALLAILNHKLEQGS